MLYQIYLLKLPKMHPPVCIQLLAFLVICICCNLYTILKVLWRKLQFWGFIWFIVTVWLENLFIYNVRAESLYYINRITLLVKSNRDQWWSWRRMSPLLHTMVKTRSIDAPYAILSLKFSMIIVKYIKKIFIYLFPVAFFLLTPVFLIIHGNTGRNEGRSHSSPGATF